MTLATFIFFTFNVQDVSVVPSDAWVKFVSGTAAQVLIIIFPTWAVPEMYLHLTFG